MKPNDESGKLPASQRPFRILIISGSDRRQYNCPGVDSKSRALMLRMAERLPQEWEIDYQDLGNVFARELISIAGVRSSRVSSEQRARSNRENSEPTATTLPVTSRRI